MKLPLYFLLIFLFLSTNVSSEAIDEEKATPNSVAVKTKKIVEAAYDYIQKHSDDITAVQHALQTNPAFFDRDRNLYIFVHCYDIERQEAISCGHGIRPELLGKNMWHLRTPNGRLLFHEIAQMIEKHGEGWIEYDWLNPFTKSLQAKTSFIKGIVLKDGRKAWVGCGFWEEK